MATTATHTHRESSHKNSAPVVVCAFRLLRNLIGHYVGSMRPIL